MMVPTIYGQAARRLLDIAAALTAAIREGGAALPGLVVLDDSIPYPCPCPWPMYIVGQDEHELGAYLREIITAAMPISQPRPILSVRIEVARPGTDDGRQMTPPALIVEVKSLDPGLYTKTMRRILEEALDEWTDLASDEIEAAIAGEIQPGQIRAGLIMPTHTELADAWRRNCPGEIDEDWEGYWLDPSDIWPLGLPSDDDEEE